MIFSYLTIIFSDFSPDYGLKIDLGMKATYLFFLTLFGNISVIVLLTLVKVYKAIRTKCKKKKTYKHDVSTDLPSSITKEEIIKKKYVKKKSKS